MHAGNEAYRWVSSRSAVAMAVLAFVATSRPAYAQGGCSKDTDCKGTRVCEDGRCVEPPQPGAEPAPALIACQKDTDCDGDLVCENRVCVVGGSAPASQNAAAAEPQQDEPEMAVAESEPPEPEYEEPPPQPDPAQVWIAGFWDWVNDQWFWRAGAWRTPPVGMAYVAPQYEVVRGKLAYTRGHWGSPKVKPRSYGGRALRFRAAVRPAGYAKGSMPMVKRSPGLKVGRRPVTSYRWAGKPTHQFVIPPPRLKPAVAPTSVVPRPVTPRIEPTVRPGAEVHRPTTPAPATPAGLRTPPRPLGLDSKEGTRCR
jgi:hypothetical protein